MRKVLPPLLGLILLIGAVIPTPAIASDEFTLSEFTVDKDALCQVRDRWIDEMLAENPQGHWAEMKIDLDNKDLELLGLPPREVLTAQRYAQPTLVTQDGDTYDISVSQLTDAMAASSGLPQAGTFAGTGCFGIRPGSLLLIVDGGSISLCSLAHLYGGAISTAGHCGNVGTTATVIAAFGNRADVTGVVLLDFGRFSTSHNNGLGDDYALIDIDPAFSALVTPTMCFWGGPRGVYSAEGDVAAFNANNGEITVDPNPFLAQAIVHYGHGAGVGAGGTPRVGAVIAWRPNHYMFFGAISPGDSGSGSNTLLGDTVGANMQAAGINTHLWIDALMRDGFGIMGGTRATKIGTPTPGQIVPYPIPIAGLP